MLRAVARSVLLAVVGASLVAAQDPPRLPGRISLDKAKLTYEVAITLESRFRSDEHKLRSVDDDARIEAVLDLSAGETRGDLVPVEATFRSLSVERSFKARVAGFLGESEKEGRGSASFHGGDDPPPAWRMLVTPRGLAIADASPVTSARAIWPGERWLDPRDEKSHEDAKVRRLARYLDMGTLAGAPELPGSGETRFEATFPITIGESGLTNSFVELSVVYDISIERGEGETVRARGKLARVSLVKGRGAEEKRVDRWLDLAFARGGPKAEGEIEAAFDLAKGRFREVKSRLLLSHEGHFDGGKGKASIERRLVVRER